MGRRNPGNYIIVRKNQNIYIDILIITQIYSKRGDLIDYLED
jgi:hypothetical protein